MLVILNNKCRIAEVERFASEPQAFKAQEDAVASVDRAQRARGALRLRCRHDAARPRQAAALQSCRYEDVHLP